MEQEKLLKKIETIKKSVEQMKIEDIEENPEAAYEEFQCECCGEMKIMAGSLIYQDYRLCNDCVLLAETSFALGKMTDIKELLEKMEDKKFETVYHSIFGFDENSMN